MKFDKKHTLRFNNLCQTKQTLIYNYLSTIKIINMRHNVKVH